MHKGFVKTAALLGAISVALGAFAAHGLRQVLQPDTLSIFETAVRYQFYHVFALLATGILFGAGNQARMQWAGKLFIAGIILFCGSLYLLCYIRYSGMNMGWIGAVTPFGGVAFIAGWVMLFVAVSSKRS